VNQHEGEERHAQELHHADPDSPNDVRSHRYAEAPIISALPEVNQEH
jgi:hypothetical protein